jgi:formyl-CoA transferase
MNDMTLQPLAGIRVLDFTQIVLGPCCTQLLADFGADVVKIERPGTGDLLRSTFSEDPETLRNPVFKSVNRNKRSIAIDVGTAAGKEVIYRLARTADVVVNNFRPGVMERIGFGHEKLSQINPRIVSAYGSGFGTTGPLSHKGGQDVLAQAFSGVMARRSDESVPMSVYATALADYTASMHLAQAILLALMQRDRTGRGQEVSVSLFESMLAMQVQEVAMLLQRSEDLNWGARPLTGVFDTTDGALVLVGAFKPNPLGSICAALGIEDLSQDSRYRSDADKMRHKHELQSIFRSRFATNTTVYWISRLEEQDLLCAPVLTLREALDHEQTRVNGSIIDIDNCGPVMRPPLKMDDSAFQVRYVPPALGQQSEEILAEAGFTADEIAELHGRGVIGVEIRSAAA